VAENRYRKIEVRMWGDEKFRALSPIDPSGQALWVFLLTGPHTGPIPGLFRAGRAGIAEELGWSQEAFDEAFQEAFRLGMVEADWKARVVFIPNAIKCNPPQSPNVVTGWAGEWQLIPECELKRKAYRVLKSAVYEHGEAFAKAFDKAFAKAYTKTSPNQEQEQEQEQEPEKNICVAASATPPVVPVLNLPLNNGTEYPVMPDSVKEWATLYQAVDVLQELRNMRGWLLANKRNRKTKAGVERFITAWLSKEQDRAPRVPLIAPVIVPQRSKSIDYCLPSDLDRDTGQEIWRSALGNLAKLINTHSYNTWLRPTRAAGIRDQVLYVKLPSADFSHVREKYAALLDKVLPGLKVEFVAPQEIPASCSENPSPLPPVSCSAGMGEVGQLGVSANR
jgi:hypothetical protein